LFNHQTDEDDSYFDYRPAPPQNSAADPSHTAASPH